MESTEVLYMQHVKVGSGRAGLNDFCFHICRGEMVELCGISGAGKTAFYNYLMGYEPLKSGRVTFCQKSYGPPEKFSDTGDVVCISRKSSLIHALTIAENLCIITGRRKVRGFIRRKQLNYRINLLLQQYIPGLSAEMRASELTTPQKHMVELLRALENEAKLIYLDDIMAGYGQMDLQKMERLLAAVKEKNIAIICARRVMRPFSGLTRRLNVLSHGVNVKTFYEIDFDQNVFNQWLLGSDTVAWLRRTSYKTETVIFETSHLTGENYITDLSMSICRGEVVGFYDMNNHANIEAARIVAGLQKKYTGSMHLCNKNYCPHRAEEAVRAGAAYIPWYYDASGIVETLDFAENIYLPIMRRMSHFGWIKNQKAEDFIKREYLSDMDILPEDADEKAGLLSVYARMEIVLKKWILAAPKLLVCEALAEDNDMRMRNIVVRAVDALAGEGTAVIITAHDMKDLMNLCDTVYVMNSFGNEKRAQRVEVIRNV